MGQYRASTPLTNIGVTMSRRVTLNIPGLKHTFTIGEDGSVTNETNGKTLKGTSISTHNRYVKIHLDKFYPLHRLVAIHFIPNPDNLPQVNHKDGDRMNNSVSNLEWCSSSDNVSHAYRTGLKTNHGEKNPFRKLTESEVKDIWALRHSGLTARQIKERLNLEVTISCIKLVRSGKAWASVTSRI